MGWFKRIKEGITTATDEKKETKEAYKEEIDAYLGIMGMEKSRR